MRGRAVLGSEWGSIPLLLMLRVVIAVVVVIGGIVAVHVVVHFGVVSGVARGSGVSVTRVADYCHGSGEDPVRGRELAEIDLNGGETRKIGGGGKQECGKGLIDHER
jgi:hypothetical protein